MIYYEEEVKYIEKRRPELTGKLHDFWEITGDFLFVIFYGFEIIYIWWFFVFYFFTVDLKK